MAVQTGVEVLFGEQMGLLRGRRVGLITNPTGVDGRLRSTAELFRDNSDFHLTALYGPEHGVRGNAQAGEFVDYYQDEHLGVPVFSLYGQALKLPDAPLADIDVTMRSFDTQHTGKTVEQMERDGDRDRWFTAQEALEYGFIDHIREFAGSATGIGTN